MGNSVHRVIGLGDITLDVSMRSKCPPHFHETYAVGFFRSPALLFCRGTQWRIGAGQIAVHHPCEVHWGDPAGTCTQDLIYISPVVLNELFGSSEPMFFPLPVLEDAALTEDFEEAFRVASAGQRHKLRNAIESLFLRHALRLMGNNKEPLTSALALENRGILSRGVAELSADAGVSRSHFSRTFRQKAGLSPRDFRRLSRIEIARRLIDAGGKLAQVAADAGFADQAHMTRQFRQILGVTPGAVKNQART